MKNLINPNSAAKVVALFTLILINAFFFTACQKAPLLTQDVNAVAGRDDELGAKTAVTDNLAAAEAGNEMELRAAPLLIKIEHRGSDLLPLPIYTVSVYKDAVVIFKGVKNVKFIGTRQIKMEAEAFSKLIQLPDLLGIRNLKPNYPGSPKEDLSITKVWTDKVDAAGAMIYKHIKANADVAPTNLIAFQLKGELLMGIAPLRGF